MYDGYRFDCAKVEVRAGTIIRNSVARGEVKGDSSGAPFVIEDTTIRSGGCATVTAIGNANYVVRRVEVVGFVDAFRVEWSTTDRSVVIEDSYALTCHTSTSHGDGLQGFNARNKIVFRGNTVDMPGRGGTAPVFWADGSSDGGVFANNLLKGGSYTLRVESGGGHTVTGDRIVKDAWEFGPMFSPPCDDTWTDNRLVTLGSDYAVSSIGAEVKCS